jgi:hypothetical protein
VNDVLAEHTNQQSLELVERDVKAYLATLGAHWQDRKSLLIENVREMVHTHLLGPAGDCFVDILRTFVLQPGDEKLIEDDTAGFRAELEKLRRDRRALTSVKNVLLRAMRVGYDA